MKQFFTTILVLLKMSAVFCQANTTLSNLTAPTAINRHLLPNTANSRDLGSSTLSFRNLYIRGGVELDGTRFLSNAPGTEQHNTFVGANSGLGITSGFNNTAVGYRALYKATTGYANTALGTAALYNNTSGFSNIAVGARSLYANTAGYWNIALGDSALYSNTTGYYNSVLGANALYSNTTGNWNTAVGNFALYSNKTGTNNNAIGVSALYYNSTGYINNALGDFALFNNTTGVGNTAFGQDALFGNTSGNYNTGVGVDAGDFSTSYGTFIGAEANSISGLTNVTAIGYNAFVDVSNRVRVGNTAVTSIGGQVNWTTFSDGRYKQDVKENVHGLDFINSLRPITYTVDVKRLNAYYNKGRKELGEGVDGELRAEQIKAEAEASKIVYNGFVAQEVEKAAQKLNYEFSGVDKPENKEGLYGLRYSDFVVPLVKAVQELSKENEVTKEENKQLRSELAELRQMVLELKRSIGIVTATSATSAYLEQNTPNPVSSATIIRYHLPENVTSAVLNITNAEGKLMKTITLNASSKQVSLNTSAFAAGTYNYTLYVDGKQGDTKRLVIAR